MDEWRRQEMKEVGRGPIFFFFFVAVLSNLYNSHSTVALSSFYTVSSARTDNNSSHQQKMFSMCLLTINGLTLDLVFVVFLQT